MPARQPIHFLSAVEDALDWAPVRTDLHHHVAVLAECLAAAARWDGVPVALPTWPVLVERTGSSRTSVARYLRWLRAHQLIGHYQPGKAMLGRREAGAGVRNQPAGYVLYAPREPPRRVRPLAGPAAR